MTDLVYDETDHRPIPGYEDYEINPEGFIWSNKSNQYMTEKVSGKSPYPKLTLYNSRNSRKRKNFLVHRLVAEAFITKPRHPDFNEKEWAELSDKAKYHLQGSLQVDHIDGDPKNYHASNLRWVTAKENIDYYYNEQKYLK
jgi:hypothetical protein